MKNEIVEKSVLPPCFFASFVKYMNKPVCKKNLSIFDRAVLKIQLSKDGGIFDPYFNDRNPKIHDFYENFILMKLNRVVK